MRVLISTPASRAFSASRSQQLHDDRRRRERLRRDLEIAGLHLRHVEDAVDHRQADGGRNSLISLAYSSLRAASNTSASLRQHFREADDRVERRAQLVAHGGEEAALGGIGALLLGARDLERLLVASCARSRRAAPRPPRARSALGGLAIERPAAHLDPDEMAGLRLAVAAAAHAEFDRARFAERRRIGERGEIGRPVGDMHAVEQAVAVQGRRRARRTAIRPPATRTAPRRCGRGG